MVNWGIIGSGFITRAMLDAVEASVGSTATHIYGRNTGSREALRAEYGIAHSTDDYAQLLLDPAVDAVYIGLPNHLHLAYAEQALAAGKAVLCEKSLTVTLEEAEALVAKARSAAPFLVEGLMYLAHPIHHKLLELLQSGRMGKLHHVQGFYAADIWQVVNPNGGGTLFNLGCYPASLLHLVVQALCGADAFAQRRISAFGTHGPDGNLIETSMAARFDNGVTATLHSTDGTGMAHGFTVVTDRGTLRFETNPWLPDPDKNVFVWQPYDGPSERFEANTGHDAFYHQVQMVEQALAEGWSEAKRPSPRLADSLEIIGFLNDWQAAAEASLT